MMRKPYIILLLLVFCFGACKGRDTDNYPDALAEKPPVNIENICSIYREKSHWKHHIVTASNRWRIPPHVMMAIMRHESRFIADAKNPQSTAFGYAQAIDSTWEQYRQETGNNGAHRVRFSDAIDFIGWYANKTREVNRISDFDAVGHYLAYHQGHTGFKNKSFAGKNWLIDYANRVGYTANMYALQLNRCK